MNTESKTRIVCALHPSTRFPEKNRLLLPYTVKWLQLELGALQEEVSVHFIACGYDGIPAWLDLPEPWETHELPGDVTHLDATRYAQGGGVNIQLQLTQPLRRAGLLGDMITATRNYGLAYSVTETKIQPWRVAKVGRDWLYTAHTVGKDSERKQLLLDGACYGWIGDAERIFTHPLTGAAVRNWQAGALVDVDSPGDMPIGLDERFNFLTA